MTKKGPRGECMACPKGRHKGWHICDKGVSPQKKKNNSPPWVTQLVASALPLWLPICANFSLLITETDGGKGPSCWGVSWACYWKPIRHTVDKKKGDCNWPGGAFPASARAVGWLCLFSGAMSCSGGKQRSFTLNLAGQFVACNDSLRCSKLYLEMDISSLEPWETIKHLFEFLSGFAVCKSFIPAPAPLS